MKGNLKLSEEHATGSTQPRLEGLFQTRGRSFYVASSWKHNRVQSERAIILRRDHGTQLPSSSSGRHFRARFSEMLERLLRVYTRISSVARLAWDWSTVEM